LTPSFSWFFFNKRLALVRYDLHLYLLCIWQGSFSTNIRFVNFNFWVQFYFLKLAAPLSLLASIYLEAFILVITSTGLILFAIASNSSRLVFGLFFSMLCILAISL
jgi:hypothetical protein